MPNPSDPTPEFAGECAFAVSLGKAGVPGSSRHQVIEDGKVYRFKNPVAKLLWKVVPGRRQKAEAAWSRRS